jgi:hypothetical protein
MWDLHIVSWGMNNVEGTGDAISNSLHVELFEAVDL